MSDDRLTEAVHAVILDMAEPGALDHPEVRRLYTKLTAPTAEAIAEWISSGGAAEFLAALPASALGFEEGFAEQTIPVTAGMRERGYGGPDPAKPPPQEVPGVRRVGYCGALRSS